jgi:hypothetical protein
VESESESESEKSSWLNRTQNPEDMSGDAADEEEDKQLEQNFSELQVRFPLFPLKTIQNMGIR